MATRRRAPGAPGAQTQEPERTPDEPRRERVVRPVEEGTPGHTYRYTGEGEAYFSAFGITLRTGEKVTLDSEVDSPVLKPVGKE